ncbi:MAG: hypothetical protein LBP95_00825 [Deltaproteobacteria bacterium]|jgi:hypothetical protein|nr:hypothetical protein [Deltaproteobacteria bacterium]
MGEMMESNQIKTDEMGDDDDDGDVDADDDDDGDDDDMATTAKTKTVRRGREKAPRKKAARRERHQAAI